jgi:hypothetical protein
MVMTFPAVVVKMCSQLRVPLFTMKKPYLAHAVFVACLFIFGAGSSNAGSLEKVVDQYVRFIYYHNRTIHREGMPHPQIIFAEGNVYGACISDRGMVVEATNAYCPYSNTITLDKKQLNPWLAKHGPNSIFAVLAHEYGHYLQTVMSSPKAHKDWNEWVLRADPWMELQADCVAGNILAAAELTDEQAHEAMDLMRELGTHPGPKHGSSLQRLAAFSMGFKDQVERCGSKYLVEFVNDMENKFKHLM